MINNNDNDSVQYSPGQADTCVVVDSINTLASIHTRRICTIFIICLTIDAREAKRTCTCI